MYLLLIIVLCAVQSVSAAERFGPTGFRPALGATASTSMSSQFEPQPQEHSIVTSLHETAQRAQLPLDNDAVKGMLISIKDRQATTLYSLAGLVHVPYLETIEQLKNQFWKAFLAQQVNEVVITGFASLKRVDTNNSEQAADNQLALQAAQEFVQQKITHLNVAVQAIKVPWVRLSLYTGLAALGTSGMLIAGYLSRIDSSYAIPLFGVSLPFTVYSCRKSHHISSECCQAILDWIRLSLVRRHEMPQWEQFAQILQKPASP